MQISTPTQTLPAQAYVQEGSSASSADAAASPFSGKAHNRNAVSFFAKLLETLMGKGKGEPDLALVHTLGHALEESGQALDGGGIEGAFALAGQRNPAEQSFSWTIQTVSEDFAAQRSVELPAAAEEVPPGYLASYAPGQAADDLLNAYRAADGEKNAAKTQAELAKHTTETEPRLSEAQRFAEAQIAAKNAAERQAASAKNAPAENHAVYKGIPQPDIARRKDLPDGEGDKGRLNIEVRDLRTTSSQTAANAGASAAAANTRAQTGLNSAAYAVVNADINAGLSQGTAFDAIRQLHAENGITVDLRASVPVPERQGGRIAGGADFFHSRFLEDALARELRGNLSADIVRNASLIVRNGGEGTIRLALHPASLGHVKIHLEMTENKIIGRIIVESSEALRAFQKELPVLEKAFKDSGFMEASLDMSLAQDEAYSGGDFGQQQDGDFSPLDPALAAAIAASRYDYALEHSEAADELSGTTSGEAALLASEKRKTVNLFV